MIHPALLAAMLLRQRRGMLPFAGRDMAVPSWLMDALAARGMLSQPVDYSPPRAPQGPRIVPVPQPPPPPPVDPRDPPQPVDPRDLPPLPPELLPFLPPVDPERASGE
jgi:hypothetical protein